MVMPGDDLDTVGQALFTAPNGLWAGQVAAEMGLPRPGQGLTGEANYRSGGAVPKVVATSGPAPDVRTTYKPTAAGMNT